MTHDERVHNHMYETCDGIAEHAERIASLEELVLDMWGWLTARTMGGATLHDLSGRMRDLGVEP